MTTGPVCVCERLFFVVSLHESVAVAKHRCRRCFFSDISVRNAKNGIVKNASVYVSARVSVCVCERVFLHPGVCLNASEPVKIINKR